MTSEILSTVEAGTLTLQIHRPERKNALNLAMYTALSDKLDEAAFSLMCAWFCCMGPTIVLLPGMIWPTSRMAQICRRKATRFNDFY